MNREMLDALPIVEPGEEDLTLEQASLLAGRSSKTLRRAVHSGDLAKRYTLGPRGPQLVFEPLELQAWIDARDEHVRRASVARVSANGHAESDISALLSTIGQLQTALDQSRATLVQLAARLRDQDSIISQAQATIDQLARRLGELDSLQDGRPPGIERGADVALSD